MAEYPVNRGIGKPVEFKGLKSQYLFHLCGRLARRVRGVHRPVHGGREPVGLHRLHRVSFAAARVADLPAQCPVRHIRADEDSRPQTASTFHYQPQGDSPIIHL